MALCISNERKYSSSIESSVSLSNELQQPLRTIRYVFTLASCDQTEAMDQGNKVEAVEVIRVSNTIYIKPQFKIFILDIILGHQRVKPQIRCRYCIPWVPSFRLIFIKSQLKHFLFVEVIKFQCNFNLRDSNTNQECSRKIERFDPKMKAGTPPSSTPQSPLYYNLTSLTSDFVSSSIFAFSNKKNYQKNNAI